MNLRRRFTFAWSLAVLLALGLLSPIAASGVPASRTVTLDRAANRFDLTAVTDQGLAVEFGLQSLDITPINTPLGEFSLLAAPGLSRSQRVGEPALPVASRIICVPLGADVSARVVSARSEEISLADLGLTSPIMPAQPSVSKSDDPEALTFVHNEAVYQTAGFYTLPPVQIEILGILRSVRLARLTVAPVEYNPTQNKLRVYSQVSVQVEFRGSDKDATSRLLDRQGSPAFEPVLNQVDNYASFSSVYTAPQTIGAATFPIKYLIIADRMFEAQLADFVEWKTRRGFNVVVAYTDVIGSTSTAVRAYIQGLYNAGTAQDPAPSYVLLVGDAQQIPPFTGTTANHVTDLYFCEFTDDYLPEIYYGRFSAQSTAELQPQIDKTQEYEQYLMPDPSYLANVTLVAGVDPTYAEDYANGQINYGANLYFNVAHGFSPNVWLYPGSDDPGAAADILQTISDGVGLYNYTAHCNHPGHADPSFTTGDFGSLGNLHKYLLAIGNCCAANTFGANYSSPCFGEAFLQAEDKGGIGYIGASNNTFWDEDYYWAVGAGPILSGGPTYEQTGLGAYDNMFHEHGETVTAYSVSNGAIQVAGNLAVAESGSVMSNYYWEVYHLMGDPSVMTYLGLPASNTVSYDTEVPLSATSLEVAAETGSYVGLSQNGQLLGGGWVDNSGLVDISFVGVPVLGSADLVVTAQNRIPNVDNFLFVSPSAPFVIYDSSHVDDPGGDDNGSIDAGETIGLGVQAVNAGVIDADNCTATLSTTDPFVSITDDTEFYGTVPGGLGTVYIDNAFGFDVSPGIPDKHWITFDFEVTGQASWQSSFKLQASAPLLDYLSYVIDDATGGDGDGELEAGESAYLAISVVNNGSGLASAAYGAASAADSYVSVTDADGFFDDIDPDGGEAPNSADPFELYVSPACPDGHAASIQIVVTTAGGYTDTLDFKVTVGQRVVLAYDDFTVNQGWGGLGGYGEWTIGPSQGFGGDPSEDHSDNANNRLLGNDLTFFGTYARNLDTTMWVYSPVLDCSQACGVALSFYRWLGIQNSPSDLATLEVFNGAQWVSLFVNGPTLIEQEWQRLDYDLSAAADGNSQFRLRFGIGPTDNYESYCGWNIDNLEIRGFSESGVPTLTVSAGSVTDTLQPDSTAFDTIWFKNDGPAPLTFWTITGQSWLQGQFVKTTVPAGDSVAFDLAIAADDIEFGDNAGLIEYASNAPGNLVGSIDVAMHKLTPDIAIDSSGFSYALRPPETAESFFEITNVGTGRLDIQIQTQIVSPPGGDWLTVTGSEEPLYASGSTRVDLFMNSAGLNEPNCLANVLISSNDPDFPLWSIPVTLVVDTSCCEGLVGDVNGVGGEYPTIGDIALLIDVLFIQDGSTLPCLGEADANLSGGGAPTLEDITIGDISTLIDILFISNNPPAPCP